MRFKTILELLQEGFENIIKNRLMSFVAITTVIVSLTIFGIMYMIVDVVDENITNMQEEVEIVAFINEDVKKDRIIAISKEIEKVDNVKSIEYISSEDGLLEYNKNIEITGDKEMARILETVVEEDENPIPASFSIKTVDPFKNEEVKNSVETFEEIYKVNDGNMVTDFLNSFNKYTKIIGSILIGVLMFASILLISNSIKVAVFIRKKEISIIKYIGATNNYIRLPFIIEGLLIGTVGAILSALIIGVVYNGASPTIINAAGELMAGFTIPQLSTILVPLLPMMLAIGAGIGVIGSFVSIRKYLKV